MLLSFLQKSWQDPGPFSHILPSVYPVPSAEIEAKESTLASGQGPGTPKAPSQ